MKIDENIINEKAIEMIYQLIDPDLIYDTSGELRDLAVLTLGRVRGILDMAGALKGELKNETHHQGVSE